MPEEAKISFERDTAEIVAAYLRHNQLPTDQVGALIRTVHEALRTIGNPPEAVAELTPAVPVRRSVHRDYVVCLDCGWRGKMLRRHVASAHSLTPAEYRTRWSLPREHPLTAPGYSETRSGLAKTLGLGRRRRDGEQPKVAAPNVASSPRKRAARRKGAG